MCGFLFCDPINLRFHEPGPEEIPSSGSGAGFDSQALGSKKRLEIQPLVLIDFPRDEECFLIFGFAHVHIVSISSICPMPVWSLRNGEIWEGSFFYTPTEAFFQSWALVLRLLTQIQHLVDSPFRMFLRFSNSEDVVEGHLSVSTTWTFSMKTPKNKPWSGVRAGSRGFQTCCLLIFLVVRCSERF